MKLKAVRMMFSKNTWFNYQILFFLFIFYFLVLPGSVFGGSTPTGELIKQQGSGTPTSYGDYIGSSGGLNTYYSYFIEVPSSAGDLTIISRHLLPNSLGPIIVSLTLGIPRLIMFEATLSFIGLGVPPPFPSWGQMLNEGWRAMRADPHLILFPALTLSLVMLAFNFLGDGMRDALDPQMRGTT